jgi:hypothetical protein
MKNTKLGRGRNLFLPEAILFLCAALLILSLFGPACALFFLLVLLCFYVLYHLLDRHRREQTRLLITTKALANARLLFIRRLITLSYETDKELFHRKFRAVVCVGELRKAGIVQVHHTHLGEKVCRYINDKGTKRVLTAKDIELCCLLLHGFSPVELTVIYNLKSIGNAYIKRYRLRNKLCSLGITEIPRKF